jgi:hypothetical protein
MTEARLGKMAQDKSSADGERNFGQSLVQDHTKSYEELKREEGSAFNRRFAAHEAQDHRKTNRRLQA